MKNHLKEEYCSQGPQQDALGEKLEDEGGQKAEERQV